MKYKPKEIHKVIANGKVGFKVIAWDETYSQKGEEMTTVTLLLEDSSGVTKEIKDHFLNNEKMIFKLGIFAKAIGVYDKYMTGELEESDVLNKTGHCKIDRIDNPFKDAQTEKIIAIIEYYEKK